MAQATTTKLKRQYYIENNKSINLAITSLLDFKKKHGITYQVEWINDGKLLITALVPQNIASNLDKAMRFAMDCGIRVSYDLICHNMEEYKKARGVFQENFGTKLKRPLLGRPSTTTVHTNKGSIQIFERELKEQNLTTKAKSSK